MLGTALGTNSTCTWGIYFVGYKKVYVIRMLTEDEGECVELRAVVGKCRDPYSHLLGFTSLTLVPLCD